MTLIDWLIVIIPTAFVVGVGLYSRRYVRGVVDFLAAGRVCGRYVLCVGDVANTISIMGLVAVVEMYYKSGFALSFWNLLLSPVTMIIGLTGLFVYRYRETKAMSIGQFLEIRYSRRFRIFAATLRSLTEMLTNMIMPAIAARFLIHYLDIPPAVNVFGITVPMFMLVIVGCLTIAIALICMGGSLALVITDAIQGMFVFPLIAILVVFILVKFSWDGQIIPVMMDRVPGQSFLNPFDISDLRDFNLFMVFVLMFTSIYGRGNWLGHSTSGAAKNAHEQKMANLLGTWRSAIVAVFYVLIAAMIITLMTHRDFAGEARDVRDELSARIATELVPDPDQRVLFSDRVSRVSEQTHRIGIDPPLSQAGNLDTPLLNSAEESFREFEGESAGNAKFQQFRTLYHQMMLAISMRQVLPPVLTGLFCLLMIFAMISTDDTRIFSSAMTITQDVVMPLRKTPFSPKQHMRAIRLVAMGVGVFFFCGSYFMAQMEYIYLFLQLMASLWAGAGAVMLFGLYSKFGTTAGAFTSLISGMVISLTNIFLTRNWANRVYPWLDEKGWVEPVGRILEMTSRPFHPHVVWNMNPVRCPINAFEFLFMTSLTTLVLYVVVSKLTLKDPFNIERMLHRGKYNIDGENKERMPLTLRTFFPKLIGITKEYTKGDKVIAWSFVIYSLGFSFLISFALVALWNSVSPWPIEWWSQYFFFVALVIPGIIAAVSTVWFGIGGMIDLFRMFRDLEKRMVDPLDDGWVEGHISLAEKAAMEKLDQSTPNGEQASP